MGYIRHVLKETPSAEFIRAEPHRFVDTATGHAGMTLVLTVADGTMLLQTITAHRLARHLDVASASQEL